MTNTKVREYSETVPYQYQDRKAHFMGMDVFVDPRVFIPRPETEVLVSSVAGMVNGKGWTKPRILDVGTGSGIIPLGLTQLIDSCVIMAVDISREALGVAARNVRQYGRQQKVMFARSDMFSIMGTEHINSFDVIVSNPPYVSRKDYAKLDAWVKAEPMIALYGGEDGMDFYRIIAKEGLWYLKKGGLLAVEVGYDQSEKVKELFIENGLVNVEAVRDFNGYDRVITGWKFNG
jgi:release factor glutamine methyltransferase